MAESGHDHVVSQAYFAVVCIGNWLAGGGLECAAPYEIVNGYALHHGRTDLAVNLRS